MIDRAEGASSTPSITFSVGDPCRDYQFRVLLILRTTNPSEPFLIFRARPIPVRLPAFSIHPDEVRVPPSSQMFRSKWRSPFLTSRRTK